MLIRLLDYLRIVRGVWLLDHDGDVTASYERVNPFGIRTARRFWHKVQLLDDGTCLWVSYVKKWKYMRERGS